ncbi:MAG: MmgE/PrpD family protein [Betaproteobacteria bacterium]|nr:MmgE/PrpD family protein [Betaproteobacteria bacterium]
MTKCPTATLAAFAAELAFDAIPHAVVRKMEDLLVDWFGSAVAGHGARPVQSIAAFAMAMGPQSGLSELIVNRTATSPYLAAMANAAASHVAEQDDVHNGAVFHPGTVVLPAAVAVAQAIGASGIQLLTASIAGYEVGIRVGEFLGRSHYKVFHTTGTAGTLAAAAAVGRLLGLSPQKMEHAFGSAGTQSAGLWEFLRTGADSKQLHTAHAAAAGLMSAYLANDGFSGADALLQVMQAHNLQPSDLRKVVAHVHQGAIDVLGPVRNPSTVHQSKFSMGTVLALVARFGHAGLVEFEQHFQDPQTLALCARVEMQLDPEVDHAYPQRWIGKVTVYTADGRVLNGRMDEPKGDPGNTLDREEITAKALRLAAFSGGATAQEMQQAVNALWGVSRWPRVGRLLAPVHDGGQHSSPGAA